MATKHRLGSVQSLSSRRAPSGYLPYLALPKETNSGTPTGLLLSFRMVYRDNRMAGDALVAGKVACRNRYHGILGYIELAVH